jgi:hypothetical protein
MEQPTHVTARGIRPTGGGKRPQINTNDKEEVEMKAISEVMFELSKSMLTLGWRLFLILSIPVVIVWAVIEIAKVFMIAFILVNLALAGAQ